MKAPLARSVLVLVGMLSLATMAWGMDVETLRKFCEESCGGGGRMCGGAGCGVQFEPYDCKCSYPPGEPKDGIIWPRRDGTLVHAGYTTAAWRTCHDGCQTAADARDKVCAEDFGRARCAAPTGAAIAICNAEVRANRDQCLGGNTTWETNCNADCDAWEPKYEVEWPVPTPQPQSTQ